MMLRYIFMYSAQLCAFLFLSLRRSWHHVHCECIAAKTEQQFIKTVGHSFYLKLFVYPIYLMQVYLDCFFLFPGLGKSAVQLFRELSNPAFDLSCAVKPNRIVVLTPMTIPPAVAEPPVGHQLKCACGGRVRRVEGLTDRERDRNRLTGIGREDLCDAQSEVTEEEAQRRKTPEVLYFWTTTSSILL